LLFFKGCKKPIFGLQKHLTAKNSFYPRNYTNIPSAVEFAGVLAGCRRLDFASNTAKNMHASADSNNILYTAHLLNSKLKQKNKRNHSALVL
jgi:hypothetical protein